MHSFWFIESERSFLQAATLDPDMAMAYWGISVSAAGDYRPAFQLLRDPNDGGRAGAAPAPPAAEPSQRTATARRSTRRIRAREAIEKAMALRDKVTPRERLYIEAECGTPQPGVEDARRRLHRRPAQAGRRVPRRPRGEVDPRPRAARRLRPVTQGAARRTPSRGSTLLEEVVAKDDNHFGAHHYLIHGWEGSTTPEKAWHACKRYPAARAQHPARAAHARPHLRAERPHRRRGRGVRRGRGQRARLAERGRALPERPSRPQRALPGAGAESRRPLSRIDGARADT